VADIKPFTKELECDIFTIDEEQFLVCLRQHKKEAEEMIAPDDTRRADPKNSRTGHGWSSLHSWIFLAIVAVGLFVIGWQNRYYYLSPLGLGKAYRIDKLFGGIQEFDPKGGWIKAEIPSASSPPPQSMSMMEPPRQPGSPGAPMNMPSMTQPPSVSIPSGPPPRAAMESPAPPPTVMTKETPEEPRPTTASSPRETVEEEAKEPAKETAELSEKEKLDEFNKTFPDFGKDEFQLANDDLYPDWKKRISPDGTWSEFLDVYGQFVQWWTDQGSPPEPGFKLWKEFTSKSLKHESRVIR
jgi:hypothetical protein